MSYMCAQMGADIASKQPTSIKLRLPAAGPRPATGEAVHVDKSQPEVPASDHHGCLCLNKNSACNTGLKSQRAVTVILQSHEIS